MSNIDHQEKLLSAGGGGRHWRASCSCGWTAPELSHSEDLASRVFEEHLFAVLDGNDPPASGGSL